MPTFAPRVRTSEREDAMMSMRLGMPVCVCLRVCLLVVAASAVGLPRTAMADPRPLLVVIVPPARVPEPQPPPQAPPQKLWLPEVARGPLPGSPSPVARCYAATAVCPLDRPEQVGQACTCTAPGGATSGRALIPPSRDMTGRPRRTVQ